jgi:hypothetical protein
MEAIISISLIALVVILGSICFWQRLIIKVNRQDADTIQEKVWGLQDKYSIPDEEIRACFYPEHN